MTITYVGTGVGTSANNASVTPALPSGLAVGDALVVMAAIRNSGTGAPVQPAGWATLLTFGNVALFGRLYAAGDAAPTITFTGGVANADTSARCFAFRGAATSTGALAAASATLLNSSAQNVAYPGLTPPGDGEALLLIAWKQDDNSSVTVPGGFTLVGTTSTTTGDDQSLWAGYQIQTTATAVTTGSITFTGGASAISRGILVSLRPAAAIAVIEQDVYPPRVLVSVTNIAVGEQVDIYRVVAGERTLVRASDQVSPSNAVVVVDAELPYGVPVSYVAVVAGAEYATGTSTYTLTGGKVALTDAITGQAAEVTVMSWPQKDYSRDSTTFKVGNRNVVVSGDMPGAESQIELYVETTTARDDVFALLTGATEAVVQMRQSGGYDGVDGYYAVTAASEVRWSQDGSDPRRRITLSAVEVEPWASALEATGFTLQDLADAYVGQTLNDLSSDYATLLDLALGDFS